MTVRSTLTKGDQKDQIDKEFKQSVVKPILKFHFKRDEFLGRINEFVYFLPFSDSELRQLVEFQLKMWKRISLEKHSIQLDWTEERVRIFFRARERHLRIFFLRSEACKSRRSERGRHSSSNATPLDL